MYYRRKILLSLIEAFAGKLTNIRFQKLLFLISEEQKDSSYEFIPYKFGCFSLQSYQDKRTLTKYGYLIDKDTWELKMHANFLDKIKYEDKSVIMKIKNNFGNKSNPQLNKYIYRNYPYYACNSELVEDYFDPEEIREINKQKNNSKEHKLFTIGYEGITLERYLNKLITNNISNVVDVRKNAMSMKFGFSKNQLLSALKKVNIDYYHIPDLGIETKKRTELNSQKDYDELFAEYENTTLKENVSFLDALKKYFLDYKRIALTCFEANYKQCHRSRVAKKLCQKLQWKYELVHI